MAESEFGKPKRLKFEKLKNNQPDETSGRAKRSASGLRKKIMNQENTRYGSLPALADADLTGKEDHLVSITATGVALTAAATDVPAYVVIGGAKAGAFADVQPLSGERNISVVVSESVARGDSLVLDTGNAGQAKVAGDSAAAFGIVEIGTSTGGTAIVRPINHTTPSGD